MIAVLYRKRKKQNKGGIKMLKTMSFWDLCKQYQKDRQSVIVLLQNSKRKDLIDFIDKNQLFVYGRKKDKNSLIKSVLSWLQQHYVITKRVV